jgi:glycosyltransferase involved in cell wall biosynthesis
VGSDAPLPPLKTGLFEFGQLQGETFIAPLRPGSSELEARDRRIAELDTALASALHWQRRSWFWRAFHRWRPPWDKQERIGIFTKLERSFRKRRERWSGKNKNGVAAPASQAGAAATPNRPQRETVRTVALSTERPAAWAGAPMAGGRRVLFVSGEPDTPGHVYRVDMMAAALAGRGHETRILRADQLSAHLPLAAGANVIVFWRAPWDETTATATEAARRAGAKIVFDMDDLMLDPALARSAVIDGIRAQGHDEAAMARYFHRLQQTMAAADVCTGTTRPLAAAFRQLDKIAFVLPNGFDEARYRTSRKAAASWRASRDGLVRIGYAGGTRTHQRDFRQATAALARILKEQANCRLVLFREETAAGTLPYIDLHEFPELAEVAGQIEWRRIVPFHEVPAELARFDINLAPLETGNVFCEAKSELKYFEAALVDVPTVASPTVPYAEAIRHGETGFLAGNDSQWYEALRVLVTDADLRRRVGRAAALDVLWRFGPERRTELAGIILEQIIDHQAPAAARAGELEFHRAAIPRPGLPECAEADVIFEAGSPGQCEVAVVIALHNYAGYVTEALESVKQQTLVQKELIVVEDGSTDDSLRVAHEWLQKNAAAFTRVALLKNRRNARLSRTRNTGFAFTDALFVFPLDADNLLLPGCLEACWQAIHQTDAAFAYPTAQEFGTRESQRSNGPWNPWRLVRGNYIDAMALVRRSAWAAVGGYQAMDDLGWEDYEFWCHFAEMGFRGIWVPEPLAKYRAHPQSMLHTVTDVSTNRRRVAEVMRRLHPWVDV